MSRKSIFYKHEEESSIKRKQNILILQIEDKSCDGINKIYPNQQECAQVICEKFQNRLIVNCLVYGMTQTGKTGCMTAVIQMYITLNIIPIQNIYIITGLSDKEWKKDTKNRMPQSLNSQVLHRANLPKKFTENIKKQKNCLIIMDEIQIACEEKQTIFKTFQECGFYDLKFLLENDIKLIQFSATPDGNLNDISDWKKHSAKVRLLPGLNYYGASQAIFQNRVFQYKDLIEYNNVKELKTVINQRYRTPRYHLVRVPNKRENKDGTNNQSLVINNFKNIFKNTFEYNTEFLRQKKKDINKILETKPSKHTFIFYCEILRCAKTQYKKYIGVSYERYSILKNDSTIIQGSFGRLTGYDDNGDSICFTNIDSLKNYINLWNNNMEFSEGIVWNTKTTNFDEYDNKTYSTGTFNSVKYIEQLNDNCSEKVKFDREEPIIKKFFGDEGQEAMIEFFKKEYKPKMKNTSIRGPRRKQKDNDFYKASLRNKTQVWSTQEIYNERKSGFKDGPSFRHYPCYSDTSDPLSLQWWFIYYLE